MQDVHPIGGIAGGGRVFGDRRLRPHSHHHQQALKCPRCDSLNTKFCYYNNYNLSQPRHFCKNCRRYWTKGGILRNVPVGGGCRKSKRSKPKPKPSSPSAAPNSLSSSESSTTTATTTSAVGGGAFQISEAENFGINVGLDPLMDSNHPIGDQMMFSTEIGCFPNLMGNSADPLGLGGTAETTAAFSQFLQSQAANWEVCGGGGHRDDEKIQGGMVDPTVRIEDLLQNRGSNGGLGALDWQVGTESESGGLYDLPSSGVDHQSYWNQTTSSHLHLHSQWSDNANSDLPLFLP